MQYITKDGIVNKNFYTAGIMTNPNTSVIVKKEKADRSVQGKDGTQMNTVMILSCLNYERYEHALDTKQGFVSVHAFLRERNHMFHGKTGMYRELC